jgi:hypothetical protein
MASGENPPDGEIFDYYVGPKFAGVLTFEIVDSKGQLVTRIRSDDPVPPLDPRFYPDPTYWARPPRVLLTTEGHHRFLWDLRYPEVPGMSTGPSADEAVPHDTPSVATSPFVMPGEYIVRLTAGGKTLSAPFKVVMDPRVKTSMADLQAQFDISKQMYDDAMKATSALHEITVLRQQLAARAAQPPVASAGGSLESKLTAIAGRAEGGRGGGGGGRGGPQGPPNLTALRQQLARMEHLVQTADEAPTTAQVEAYDAMRKPINDLIEQWNALKASDLKALNETLRRKKLPLLSLDTHVIDHDVEDKIEVGDIF